MIIKESRYPGEWLKSEGADGISRDTVVIARHSQAFSSGTVLGQIDISRHFAPLNPTASDGSQKARAILHDDLDAATEDIKGVVIARIAQAKGSKLVWPAGITDGQKKTAIDQLDARAIVVRS